MVGTTPIERGACRPGRLSRGELGVGGGRGQRCCRCLVGVADHGAVDVHTDRPVRLGLAGDRIDSGDQVWAVRGQVEDLILVDLPFVGSEAHGLVGPQAELRVPQ